MKISQLIEGPCDVATKDDIAHMSGPEYDKYAQWKKDCEAEERTTPLSTKRLESYDDYHGDMSKEEYDKTVNNSEMEYTVWVGGTEPNDNWLTYDEALTLYDKFKAQGHEDVQLDARIKQEIPQDIPMGIRPIPKFEAKNEEEEVWFNYEDIGGNIIVNPKSTIEDQIGELLNQYYDISPMEFDPSKIEITTPDQINQDANFAKTQNARNTPKEAVKEKQEKKEDLLKGFDPKTARAIMMLKAKYPQADNILSALLADVENNEKDSGITDLSQDYKMEKLTKAVDILKKEINLLKRDKKSNVVKEKAKPDFLDLDKDGDKKEPMKKAGKTKKEVCEEVSISGGLTGALLSSRQEKRIKEDIDSLTYDDIHGTNIKDYPEGFDIHDIDYDELNVCDRCGDIQRWDTEMYWKGEEDMNTNEVLGDEYEAVCDPCFFELSKKNEDIVKEDEEAIAARDEFLKVMDMKGKTPGPGKQIDTIKKIVADKQNMQVAFDDGKMRVDLYTASAVSQVYDAVKPETQVKIDNMLRTKAGMLKLSDFAFSKLKEGVQRMQEGKRVDEWVPLALRAAGMAWKNRKAIGTGIKKVASYAKKHWKPITVGAVAHDQYTKRSGNPHKDTAASSSSTSDYAKRNLRFVSDSKKSLSKDGEPITELLNPTEYTGVDGVPDKNGKYHDPNSPEGKMIINLGKKDSSDKDGDGKDDKTGKWGRGKGNQLKKANRSAKIGKVIDITKAAGKKLGKGLAGVAGDSGFGNPFDLKSSKYSPKDKSVEIMQKAMEQSMDEKGPGFNKAGIDKQKKQKSADHIGKKMDWDNLSPNSNINKVDKNEPWYNQGAFKKDPDNFKGYPDKWKTKKVDTKVDKKNKRDDRPWNHLKVNF
jgi:hypothetical protein